jgi:hypothetical protein
MTASARTARPAVAGAALACVAALAAACGTATPGGATATKTVTVTVTPHPGTSSPAPATSSPPGAGTASCPTRSLGLKPGLAQGAAGSTYQVIEFTNISNVTCTLYGYPGVSLAGGHPVTQVGLAAAEDPATPRQLVTLAPGQVASALLRIVDAQNYPTSSCGPVRTQWIQIYPPNQTTPAFVAYNATACSKPVRILTVGTVKPGSGG